MIMKKTLFTLVLGATLLLTFNCNYEVIPDETTTGGQDAINVPAGQLWEKCPIQFTSSVTGTTSYDWDFGDGNTSTDESPTNIYTNAGNYTVTLTVSDGSGENEFTKTIQITQTVTFEKIEDTGSSQRYRAVVTSSDGSYVMAGYDSLAITGFDAYLVKVDANGNRIWAETFGGLGDDFFSDIINSSDGEYVMVGCTDVGNDNAYAVKVDANGSTLWENNYGGSANDGFNAVMATSDGGYIMTGEKEDQIYLVKVDANGNTLWEKTVGIGRGLAIATSSDGGYMLATSENVDFGTNYIVLVKTDANGNQQWKKTFNEDSSFDFPYDMIPSTDGGYIVVGFNGLSAFGPGDAYLIKVDANGVILSEKTFGDTELDTAFAITPTLDGGYMLAGSSLNNVYLVKTDANGNRDWETKIVNNNHNEATSVEATDDCGYIITGYYNNGTDNDFYLLKTDAQGNVN